MSDRGGHGLAQQPVDRNRATRTRQRVGIPDFPDADRAVLTPRSGPIHRSVDLLFVNPPAPDRGIWIRSQHRVGRRSREGMIWPQVGLAQMAALFPDYRVEVVDAIPHRMTWGAFEELLRQRRPRYYVTQVTAPTLQNDMYGVFLAKSLGALTIAFGTHVTPLPRLTMEAYPALDYILRGEPELTLRELVDALEAADGALSFRDPGGRKQELEVACEGRPGQAWWPGLAPAFARRLHKLFTEADPHWHPAWTDQEGEHQAGTGCQASLMTRYASRIKGLVWRDSCQIVINADRPYIADLDDLPLPRHDLLPLDEYRAPLVGGPYAFVVTSRGCPGGCRFCIKHVSYGRSMRLRSPEGVLREIDQLVALGVRKIHMYADLFTVNREQVMGICRGLSQGVLNRDIDVRWTCNSRVDFVDPEMLHAMARAGCWMIAWGIESGDERMLRRMRKGTTLEQVQQALRWSKDAGMMNWGYFIIGLPGETEESIRRTIDVSKQLPLDLALFHIAAPHPGTPFFYEVVENGWFRPGTRWEEVDMDRSTVLDYPHLRAEELEAWARRAFREWALRPRPLWTYLRILIDNPTLLGPALEVGLESLGWARG